MTKHKQALKFIRETIAEDPDQNPTELAEKAMKVAKIRQTDENLNTYRARVSTIKWTAQNKAGKSKAPKAPESESPKRKYTKRGAFQNGLATKINKIMAAVGEIEHDDVVVTTSRSRGIIEISIADTSIKG
jgi:hypothetical protein